MRMASSGGSGDVTVVIPPSLPLPASSGFIDTSVTPVTNAAYTELVTSTGTQATSIEVFNKTEIPMYLAFGGAGSEVDQIIIGSDGVERQNILIPAGTRVSLKSVQAITANSGLVVLNAFG